MNLSSNSKLYYISILCLGALLTGCGNESSDVMDQPPVTVMPPVTPPSGDSPKEGDIVELTNLEPGLCVTPIGDEEFLEFMRVNACNREHLFEIVGTITSSDGSDVVFPGHIALLQKNRDECRRLFEGQVNKTYGDSPLDVDMILPSAGTWDDGDRSIICLIVEMDGKTLIKPASEYE